MTCPSELTGGAVASATAPPILANSGGQGGQKMYKGIIFVTLFISLVGCMAGGSFSSTPSPAPTVTEEVGTVLITGTVGSVVLSARVIELQSPVQGFTHIALTQETKLLSVEGGEINLRDLQVGTRIQVLGQPGASGALIAEEVRVLP